jgi:hypothetical protein
MKTKIAILLVFCLSSPLFSSGKKCADFADAIPLCAILSDAAKYDGNEVTVKGLYRMVVHGSIMLSPDCGRTNVNIRLASDYKADKHAAAAMKSLTKKDQFQSIEAVIRGTFRAARQGECFGQNCLGYEIEEHELLCAGPRESTNSSRDADPKD